MIKKILFPFCLFFIMTTLTGHAKSAAMPPPPVTQIQASQCGQVLASLDTQIYANLVAGASNYRFRVTSTLPGGTVQTQIVTTILRVFNLTQLGSYAFSKTYSVEVAANVGGVWQPYGPACNITSPTPITKIQSSQCGIPMLSIDDPIYADVVSFAPGFRFRITNANNPAQVFIVDRPLRDLRLNCFPAYSGTSYNVEVAVKNFDGTFLPYGPGCSITAPILVTKVNSSFCSQVISSFSQTLYADNVTGATGYRFKFTNAANPLDVQYLDRPLRTFTLSMLANIHYGTAYRIEVAVKDPQGNLLPFGPICTVFTPILPAPKIQLSQCEMICTSASEMMYADDYANATVYRFRLENPNIGYSYYIDRTSRCYSLNMFPGLQPNTAYTVKVAVKVNGVFTGYGKACDVTTPPVEPPSRIADSTQIPTDRSIMPRQYPNPFSDYFSIDASLPARAEVSVRVFDMMGRLLDERLLRAENLPGLHLGAGYPPGVYNVVFGANDQVKTLRVIKR